MVNDGERDPDWTPHMPARFVISQDGTADYKRVISSDESIA
jgi:hypothetical protein